MHLKLVAFYQLIQTIMCIEQNSQYLIMLAPFFTSGYHAATCVGVLKLLNFVSSYGCITRRRLNVLIIPLKLKVCAREGQDVSIHTHQSEKTN